MAKCKGCNQEVTWDDNIRGKLGIRRPAELIGTEYREHDCPKYKKSSSSSSDDKGTIGSYINKAPNPNNYTGSTADYEKKQTTPTTDYQQSLMETQKQILNEIEFMRSQQIELKDMIRNIALQQLNIKQSLLKDDDDDDAFVDSDPDYENYKNSIRDRKEKEENI